MELSVPGSTAIAWTKGGKSYRPALSPSENCIPAVPVVRFTSRIAEAPSSPTHNVVPSEEIANLSGSLPTYTGVPKAPVAGSMETIESPYGGPADPGTDTYKSPFTGFRAIALFSIAI